MSAAKNRIVAELGRPETPDETAARKAETSRKHRSNQTLLNLIGALVVSLGVVLLLVLVVVRPDPAPPEPIDYELVASQAAPTVSEPLASPALSEGWSANAAKLESSVDQVASWYIGFITPSEQFIALRQGIAANPTWLAAQLEFARVTGSATLNGVTWQLYDNRTADDPGNLAYAMTAEIGDSTIVLFGTAPDSEFEHLASVVSSDLNESNNTGDTQ